MLISVTTLVSLIESRWIASCALRAGVETNISCLKRAYGPDPLHLARPAPFQNLCQGLGPDP